MNEAPGQWLSISEFSFPYMGLNCPNDHPKGLLLLTNIDKRKTSLRRYLSNSFLLNTQILHDDDGCSVQKITSFQQLSHLPSKHRKPSTPMPFFGGGNGNPLQLFLPGKSHGQRSLVSYSPWGHKRVGHDSVTKQGPFLEFQSKYLTVKGAQCFLSLFDYEVLVFDHKALLRNDIPYCFYRSSVLSRTF